MEKNNKGNKLKKILLFILLFLLILTFFCFLLFLYKNNNDEYTFKKITDSSSIYNGFSYGIFYIGNEQYIIFGAQNKDLFKDKYNRIPYVTKKIHVEVFDYNRKKIKKITQPIFYEIINCFQLLDGNIFFRALDQNSNVYLGLFNVKNFEEKIIQINNDILNCRYSSFFSIDDENILISGALEKNKRILDRFYIYNIQQNKLTIGPQLKKPRTSYSIIKINNENILIVGGTDIENNINVPVLDIEICNIKSNTCKLLDIKLNEEKLWPKLFNDKNGNIFIFPSVRKENSTIEFYNLKNQTIKVVGQIDRYYDKNNLFLEKKLNDYDKTTGIVSSNFIQLQNGNILITGGKSGILRQKIRNDAYVYDISKYKLIKIEDMGYKRQNHLTKVLNDGNVLFLGMNQKHVQLFVTK